MSEEKSLYNQVIETKNLIDYYTEHLKKLRDACDHPYQALSARLWGNTGNYDPSDDCYGANITCDICGYRWTVEQTVWVDYKHGRRSDLPKGLK